jgi:hypothetical protein
MAILIPTTERQTVAAVVAEAVAKIELLDEALAWRRLAPTSPTLQRQVDRLRRQRESILAVLDSLRQSLVDPLTLTALYPSVPAPRPEIGATNRWWAAG